MWVSMSSNGIQMSSDGNGIALKPTATAATVFMFALSCLLMFRNTYPHLPNCHLNGNFDAITQSYQDLCFCVLWFHPGTIWRILRTYQKLWYKHKITPKPSAHLVISIVLELLPYLSYLSPPRDPGSNSALPCWSERKIEQNADYKNFFCLCMYVSASACKTVKKCKLYYFIAGSVSLRYHWCWKLAKGLHPEARIFSPSGHNPNSLTQIPCTVCKSAIKTFLYHSLGR